MNPFYDAYNFFVTLFIFCYRNLLLWMGFFCLFFFPHIPFLGVRCNSLRPVGWCDRAALQALFEPELPSVAGHSPAAL